MAFIHLTTFIVAPIERVFDLSRSITLHTISTAHTHEKAIAGITSGLINVNETVTWEARHLFKTRRFTSIITTMQSPAFFTDEMSQGDFKKFRHQHIFRTVIGGTMMIDKVEFESPFGFFGKLVNTLYLESYIRKLLLRRNAVIKEYAETGKWETILN